MNTEPTGAQTVGTHSMIQRNPEVRFTALDDEYLAIDAQAGYCYSLNGVAGRVWALMEEPMRLSTLCDQLRRDYAVDEATCLADVVELITGLQEAGLVDVDTTTAA